MGAQKNYDLDERTSKFAEECISFAKTLKSDNVSNPIINQFVRSSTSIGANYTEANGASSRKDFRNKIFICKKESQETKYWLRMLLKCFPGESEIIPKLSQEAQELTLIFQKINSTLMNNS